MNSTLADPAGSIIVCFPQPILLEDQQKQLEPMIEKIQSLSKVTLSQIAVQTISRCFTLIKRQSCSKTSFKVLAVLIYINLIGLATLTVGSAGILLSRGNYSEALTVNFANNITNSAALLTFITEWPPITLALYWFVVKKAYTEAMRKALDEGYHSYLQEMPVPEIREELYQWYILQLQDLGVDDFYLNPDPFSKTGALHEKLAHELAKIDRAIKKGISTYDLTRNVLEDFKEASCPVKLAKITTPIISICMTSLALFFILENYVLVAKTPVQDLFFGNISDQNNEAFYLTQLGGVFASVTAIAFSVYLIFFTCFSTPYKKTKQDKINVSFLKHKPSQMTSEMENELFRIKERKLKLI